MDRASYLLGQGFGSHTGQILCNEHAIIFAFGFNLSIICEQQYMMRMSISNLVTILLNNYLANDRLCLENSLIRINLSVITLYDIIMKFTFGTFVNTQSKTPVNCSKT